MTIGTIVIRRPHRSTAYPDAAYCYRPSSVVCRSVTIVSPGKTAEPIEMPFGMWTAGCLKEARIRWGAHWRHLATTIEPSVCGGDAAFLSNYSDHLFSGYSLVATCREDYAITGRYELSLLSIRRRPCAFLEYCEVCSLMSRVKKALR